MADRLRPTRHFPAAMTEHGDRRLHRVAREAGLTENEALSFLFENLDSVTHAETLPHRLRLKKAHLDARKS